MPRWTFPESRSHPAPIIYRKKKVEVKDDDETLIRQNLKYRDVIPEQQAAQHAQYMEDLNLERGNTDFDFKALQVQYFPLHTPSKQAH